MDLFLTAYDPLDLPGGSIDPLGFERGYLRLADRILPGMTNVANCPRYFGILCAGAFLPPDGPGTPREERRKRQESVLRLERLWALANVLAAREDADMKLSGIRGVTYAQRYAKYLDERGASVAGKYQLLVRQAPYGVLGIYGTVAENCRLLYKNTFELTPGLGQVLAEAFLVETDAPSAVRAAVTAEKPVPLDVLQEWGVSSSAWGELGGEEARIVNEMIHLDPVRSRFCALLSDVPAIPEAPELFRLQDIGRHLERQGGDEDLLEAVHTILAYELCYRTILLGFERLLYLCRNRTDSTGTVNVKSLRGDEVLQLVADTLQDATGNYAAVLDAERAERQGGDRVVLQDIRLLMEEATAAGSNIEILTEVLLRRHMAIQHGKFDRGRRKMPWIEKNDNTIRLTISRAGGFLNEVRSPNDITPHPYRIAAADSWLKSASQS